MSAAGRWAGNVALLVLVMGLSYTGQSLIKAGLRRVGEFTFVPPQAAALFFAGCVKEGLVWIGTLCVGAGFALWIAFLSRMDLSQAMPMIALSYVPWLFIGRFVFHEEVGPLRILGTLLILLGVLSVGYSKVR